MLLVLLPGMIGTADLFAPLLGVIPPGMHRRVVAYPPDVYLSYAQLLTLIEDELSGENDLVLVGESYSGALALAFAAAHPQRVLAVILSAGFVFPPWPSWIRWLVWRFWVRIPMPRILIRFFVAGPDASDALVNEIRTAFGKPAASVMTRRAKEVLTMHWTDPLVRCPPPMLYLAPTHDRMVHRSSLRRILRIRPDVQVREISGPHLILQAEPAKAWQVIETFLADPLIAQHTKTRSEFESPIRR